MDGLKVALFVIFNPIRGFVVIKEKREQFSYIPLVVLCVLIIAARMCTIYFTHYPLALSDPRQTNLLMECIKLFAPLLTWALACYAMTTIMDGKILFNEQLLTTAYAMIPFIILSPIYTLMSHFMGVDSWVFYDVLQTFMWGWIIVLFFISTSTMNEYKIGKTIAVCLLNIVVIAIIWILVGLFYSLADQIIVFAQEVWEEVKVIYVK